LYLGSKSHSETMRSVRASDVVNFWYSRRIPRLALLKDLGARANPGLELTDARST
jgi:hypothetical protein